MNNKNLLYGTIVFVSLIFLASVAFLASGLKGFRSQTKKNVSVTGMAERDFESDLMVWSASISVRAYNLSDAYSELSKQREAVSAFLKRKNVPADAISFSSVSISREEERVEDDRHVYYRFNGYLLTQNVTITSKDVNATEAVSRQISELITQGIEIRSEDPRYYYTKLNDLKIQMLKDASEDARNRAKVIAEGGASSLGKLQRSSMGVFQIVGQNSDEDYSWGGSFNTTSKMKTATITVTSTFALD